MKPTAAYIPYLDGLRALSILLVLTGHFCPVHLLTYLGRFGVTVFFFVSGLLITRLLLHERERQGRIDLGGFYIRRFLRLYPALTVMLGLSIVLLTAQGFGVNWGEVAAGTFYFTNYYMVFSDGVQQPAPAYFNILWSLAVEEHFYLFFPLLFIALYGSRFFVPVLAALLLLSLGLRLLHGSEFGLNYFSTHTRADAILWGCLSAVLLYKVKADWYLRLLHFKGTLYLGVLILAIANFWRVGLFQNTFAYTLFGIGLFLSVPAFTFGHWKLRNILESRPMVYIGRLSYSLYLFHWLVLKTLALYYPVFAPEWYLIGLPLSFLLSAASYHFVELPMVNIRKRFGSNVVASPMAKAA